jgi:hypothetical protein
LILFSCCTNSLGLAILDVGLVMKGMWQLMNHLGWRERETIKKVKCVHTDAKKYIVNQALTAGKIYEVKNITDEFYYIIDNSGKIGGFYKEYFQDV